MTLFLKLFDLSLFIPISSTPQARWRTPPSRAAQPRSRKSGGNCEYPWFGCGLSPADPAPAPPREDIKRKVESKTTSGVPETSLIAASSTAAGPGPVAAESLLSRLDSSRDSISQAPPAAAANAAVVSTVDRSKQCYDRATQTDALPSPSSPSGRPATARSVRRGEGSPVSGHVRSAPDAAADAAGLRLSASDSTFRGFLSRAARVVEEAFTPPLSWPVHRADAPVASLHAVRSSALAGRHVFDASERASTLLRLAHAASDGRPVGDMDWDRTSADHLLVCYAQRIAAKSGAGAKSTAPIGIPRPTDGLALVWDVPSAKVTFVRAVVGSHCMSRSRPADHGDLGVQQLEHHHG